MNETRFIADARLLLRCIVTYAEYAIEQLEKGGGISVETYQIIQLAKQQTGAALAAVVEDIKND